MYDALKSQVIYAKHLKVTRHLTGVYRTIIYYIYQELLEGINNKKFREPHFRGTTTARVDLFDIRIESGLIYIETIHNYNARRIKAFKYEKIRIEEIVEAIESAVEKAELKLEKPKSKYGQQKYTIYFLTEKAEAT